MKGESIVVITIIKLCFYSDIEIKRKKICKQIWLEIFQKSG